MSELVTIEEFAQRLSISRTTLFEWLKTGILEQGKHYIKVGRILRLYWDESLLLSIGLNRQEQRQKRQKQLRKPNAIKQVHSSDPAINFDYALP
jgi:hypothetical protein